MPDYPAGVQHPRSIDVGGIRFRITSKGCPKDAYGIADFEGRRILVNPDAHATLADLRSTLRHEVHHLAMMVSGQFWAKRVDQEVLTRVIENIYDPAVDRLDRALARLNPPE